MEVKISLNMAKERVLQSIIHAEIGSYMATYAPSPAVLPISNIMSLTGLTKYGARKALRELQRDGVIYYTSQGCPAIISYGECPELVYEARPPINGYALTKEGFHTPQWIDAYEDWNRSLAEWANGWETEE